MKIRSIELIPVTLPYSVPVSDAWGVYDSAYCGIVCVTDEAGLKGYGEISLAWFGGVHSMCRQAQKEWVPKLLGLDTRDLTAINSLLDTFCVFSRRHLLVKAGIEMAIWDLVGKELDMPVYQMLGGKLRESISLTGGVAMLAPETMVEQAQQLVEEGYEELKIKIGLDEKKDLRAIQNIRNRIPARIKLRVDVNMAWTDCKEAKRKIDDLYAQGVHMVEQPLDYRDLEGLAWLCEHTPCKILADEGIWNRTDAVRYIRAKAADVFHVYICEAGGILGAKQVFETAEAFSIPCTIGSMPEGIVGASAAAHIAAAMSNLAEYPSDLRGFTVFKEDVARTDMRISHGNLLLPKGPGLGFEIDEEKLAVLRADR